MPYFVCMCLMVGGRMSGWMGTPMGKYTICLCVCVVDGMGEGCRYIYHIHM